MAPALLLLNTHAAEFGLEHPWQFFWATGLLSSFLDNAPTYLTFAATACGIEGIPLEGSYLRELIGRGIEAQKILAAISAGAVMMGANSYIGNGPNFMVKAIAETHGVRMPSFFGYMAYSAGVRSRSSPSRPSVLRLELRHLASARGRQHARHRW
jgi:Na+/H+ antiporter NhaD/arsenite permease-like protein